VNTAVIAHAVNALYDHRHQQDQAVIGDEKWLRLKARLDRSEWLRPSEVATLLDVSRTKVHNMLTAGTLKFDNLPDSKYRVVDPASVRPHLPKRPTGP
jgi:hypothetical protein